MDTSFFGFIVVALASAGFGIASICMGRVYGPRGGFIAREDLPAAFWFFVALWIGLGAMAVGLAFLHAAHV